jgi:hypothetical protein
MAEDLKVGDLVHLRKCACDNGTPGFRRVYFDTNPLVRTVAAHELAIVTTVHADMDSKDNTHVDVDFLSEGLATGFECAAFEKVDVDKLTKAERAEAVKALLAYRLNPVK